MSVICEICKIDPSKYTCPGCKIQTCSLVCVREHKKRGTGCDGRRVPLARTFVRKGALINSVLDDDARLLESASSLVDKESKNFIESEARVDGRRRSFVGRVRSIARVNVRLMPGRMSRARANKSLVINANRPTISWTIEWIFLAAGDSHYSLGKKSHISDAKFIEIKMVHGALDLLPLKESIPFSNVSVEEFIVVVCKKHRQWTDLKTFGVNEETIIRDVLSECEVVEFPTIYVAPKILLDL